MRRLQARPVLALVGGVAIGAGGAALLTRRRPTDSGAGSSNDLQSVDSEAANNALAELSKQELYRRAQAAQIPGRSRMTREQLIAALQSPPA